MLSISSRAAKLGSGYNGRSEMSGPDEISPGMDITVKNAHLDKTEVNQFVPGFAERFFDEGGQPLLSKVYPIVLKGKIKGAAVTISDDGEPLELTDVSIQKVTFTPIMEGITKVSFQLQFHPQPGEVDWLMHRLRQDIEVSLECEQYGAQKDIMGEAA